MALDLTNTIRNLETKLKRQEEACQDTRTQIEAFKQMQAQQTKGGK